MNQSEVNRIITEKVLRECWHECSDAPPIFFCRNCGANWGDATKRPDFSHWEHYGPLLEKIQGEKYWRDIAYYTHRGAGYGEGDCERFNEDLLNPTTGSHAIAEFVVANPKIFVEVK